MANQWAVSGCNRGCLATAQQESFPRTREQRLQALAKKSQKCASQDTGCARVVRLSSWRSAASPYAPRNALWWKNGAK